MQILCVMFDVLCVYARGAIYVHNKKSGKPHIGFTVCNVLKIHHIHTMYQIIVIIIIILMIISPQRYLNFLTYARI